MFMIDRNPFQDDQTSINSESVEDFSSNSSEVSYTHGFRINEEFEILNIIGEGSFGIVLKVKNILDSKIYAIKKIGLEPSNKEIEDKIREVKLLSGLDHQNVVRYYHSWIEDHIENTGNAINLIKWKMRKGFVEGEFNNTSSDGITFEEENSPNSNVNAFMYIQMEFCEERTLRKAIDERIIHSNIPLIWRLFREITDGINHIHSRNIIHRDLKPDNIFLDAYYHVKIGDFGLATDIEKKKIRSNLAIGGDSLPYTEDESHSANIGTFLYNAPEMLGQESRSTYNQKVDMYSLGIIFFEMCYPPFTTSCERSKLIEFIKENGILLLPNVKTHLTTDIILVINWLLQDDYKNRPTADHLISSGYIPPLMTEKCKIDLHLFTDVFDIFYRIFRKQGAVYDPLPSMPKSFLLNNDSCDTVMDYGERLVSIPYGKVHFACHATQNEIKNFKMFSLEKIHREKNVFDHPSELFFTFDIVTVDNYFYTPVAEVLFSVSEIISEFPSLKEQNINIYLNHTKLLKSILIFCGVKESMENVVLEIMDIHKSHDSTKDLLQHRLLECKIVEEVITKLLTFVHVCHPFVKFCDLFQFLTQIEGDVGAFAKGAFSDMENIVKCSKAFGECLTINICPCLVPKMKFNSGILFEFVCDLKPNNKKVLDILATGGRYSGPMQSFKSKLLPEEGNICQSAVCVIIAIEKIIEAENNYRKEHQTDRTLPRALSTLREHLSKDGNSSSKFPHPSTVRKRSQSA